MTNQPIHQNLSRIHQLLWLRAGNIQSAVFSYHCCWALAASSAVSPASCVSSGTFTAAVTAIGTTDAFGEAAFMVDAAACSNGRVPTVAVVIAGTGTRGDGDGVGGVGRGCSCCCDGVRPPTLPLADRGWAAFMPWLRLPALVRQEYLDGVLLWGMGRRDRCVQQFQVSWMASLGDTKPYY